MLRAFLSKDQLSKWYTSREFVIVVSAVVFIAPFIYTRIMQSMKWIRLVVCTLFIFFNRQNSVV